MNHILSPSDFKDVKQSYLRKPQRTVCLGPSILKSALLKPLQRFDLCYFITFASPFIHLSLLSTYHYI